MIRTATARRRSAGFSLTDLLVVIVVIAAMLAVQLPSDAAARRTARRMQNSTQLRGIHQGLVTFSNANRNFFPGFNSRGEILEDADATTGRSGRGDTVQARYWILFEGDYFTPEYAISPSETANVSEYDPGRDDVSLPVQWNQRSKQYSYAFLDIHADPNNPTQVAQDAANRGREWAATLNSQAIVLSDRNTGADATDRVQSIHTDGQGDWRGSVLWNDNHVGFEEWQFFETKYGNGALNRDEDFFGADNLFSADTVGNNAAGSDALMPIANNDIVHAGQ